MLARLGPYRGGRGPGGSNWLALQNPYLASLFWISLVELPLSMLILFAQIGLYKECSWNASCLVMPAFIACLLFIITSFVGIATAFEKRNAIILTLLMLSIITVIITPINMGLWALKPDQGGITMQLQLVKTDGVSHLLVAIHLALLFLPIIVWIMSIMVVIITSFALRFSTKNTNPYSCEPAMNPGYAPSPVYGGFPPPHMCKGRPPKTVCPHHYH